MKKLVLPSFLITALFACKSGNEKMIHSNGVESENQSVIQTFEGIEIKSQTFVVEADKASIIEMKNGNRIEFPATAFVDQEGNLIHGKVNIEWQEYHSLTDIMLSGIPMKYDSAGVMNDFVSGGMFTINANQNNKKLDLASGKKAKIDLASIQDSPCYNFYELDEKKGDWKYLSTKNGIPNPKIKTEKKRNAKKEARNKPQLIDAQVDYSAFPELKDQAIVAWKTSDKLNKPFLRKRTGIYKLLAGDQVNHYVLELSYGKDKSLINVQPYTMSDAKNNLNKASQEMKNDYADELKFQNEVMTGKVIRSTEIENLGTHNWDRIMKAEGVKEVVATFNFPKFVHPSATRLFYVCPALNFITAINSQDDTYKIKYIPNKKFTIVGLTARNTIITVDPNQLNQMHKPSVGQLFNFDLTDTGRKITSGKQMAAYLQSQI